MKPKLEHWVRQLVAVLPAELMILYFHTLLLLVPSLRGAVLVSMIHQVASVRLLT